MVLSLFLWGGENDFSAQQKIYVLKDLEMKFEFHAGRKISLSTAREACASKI